MEVLHAVPNCALLYTKHSKPVGSIGGAQGTGFSCMTSTFLYTTNLDANHPKLLPGLKIKQVQLFAPGSI